MPDRGRRDDPRPPARDGIVVRVPRRPTADPDTDGLIRELRNAVAVMHQREQAAKRESQTGGSREHAAAQRGKACGVRQSRDLITSILARHDP